MFLILKMRAILYERTYLCLSAQMMEAAGVTEELKARDQLAWVGLVNNCRARVEEIIMADLIYV